MRCKNPDQTSLFERAQEKAERKAQKKNLERVRGKIHQAILEYFSFRYVGQTFTMSHLTRVVSAQVPDIAPDSPGRIMRLLRAEGLINYKVVSRKDSRYEVLEPEEQS